MGMAGIAGGVSWGVEAWTRGILHGGGREGIAGAVRFAGEVVYAACKVGAVWGALMERIPGTMAAAVFVMLAALWVSVAGLGTVIWRFSREQA